MAASQPCCHLQLIPNPLSPPPETTRVPSNSHALGSFWQRRKKHLCGKHGPEPGCLGSGAAAPRTESLTLGSSRIREPALTHHRAILKREEAYTQGLGMDKSLHKCLLCSYSWPLPIHGGRSGQHPHPMPASREPASFTLTLASGRQTDFSPQKSQEISRTEMSLCRGLALNVFCGLCSQAS